MRAISRGIALTLVAILTLNPTALGWGPVGHMAVAYVAYKKLDPAVKARVDELLKLNPDYQKWQAQIPPGVSRAKRSIMLFMLAATWPDQIKGEAGYSDDGASGGNRPDGASSSQNIGYADKLRHKYWHFVDTPFPMDSSPLPPVPTPNAETQITAFRSVLASDQPDDLKSYDLVWLLHLAGDVHQPLHCATRVSAAEPNGDNGGNNLKLSGHGASELHAFWDDLPGTPSTVKTAMLYGKGLAAANTSQAANTQPAAWIQESFDHAQQDVYVAPIGAGDGPFTITPAYRKAARRLAKQRIALAGARLANILNAELK